MSLRTSVAQWIGGKSLIQEISSSYVARTQGAPRRGTTELFASYKKSPWLRGACAKIADHISSVPWLLYRKTGSTTGKSEKNVALQTAGFATRERLIKRYTKQGTLHEIDSHPLLDLLASANPEMSGIAARKVSSISYDLKGEVFWILESDGMKTPRELWPVPPDWVTSTPNEKDPQFEVTMHGHRQKVPQEDMVWIRDLDPANPYGRGTGYGESLMDEIDTDEYAAKVAKNRFYNQGRPDMIITMEGAEQPELDAAKAKHESRFRGWQKAHRTMWSNTKVDVKELQNKFTDLQLLELRSWERQAFMTTFGIPPEIMGMLESSNRATIREAITILARMVLIPRLDMFRAELQRQLVPRFDDRLVLGYLNPVPEDDDFQLEALQAAPYMATQGEWRKLQGLEDRGDMDNVHWVPFNLMQVKPGKEPVEPEAPKQLPPPGWKVETGSWSKSEGLEEIVAEACKVERLQEQLGPLFIENLERWSSAVLTEELGLEMAFNMIDPFVVSHLENFSGTKIKDINETTKDAIRSAMGDGVRDGDDPTKMARRITAVFEDCSQRRAVLIARTEVVGTSNFGTFNAYRQSKVVQKKEWVSTMDDRVRDEHAMMNGVIVPLDQPFVLPDGAQCMYPGETGDPGHDCNERCTIVAVVDNEYSEAQLEAIWRKYDQSLLPWENKTIEACRKAFAEQEKAVIAKLRGVMP